ncbi:hypothetical protein KsCSTR_40520 [Candidatus Kuenenia stuttgartiensis]|uniref:Uncharacterized protein n=1 Tax=Kuenenia stuttgartiensis TaxID=174633 RepID=Q1Q7L9_KUEST|nr:hypothetical protein KsCSTR_40520 [Candidatus Kuenenia stuttgartiensis]CAJ70819.1 unknown protein [Candidatus Kuenenia stuttgartiensis]
MLQKSKQRIMHIFIIYSRCLKDELQIMNGLSIDTENMFVKQSMLFKQSLFCFYEKEFRGTLEAHRYQMKNPC